MPCILVDRAPGGRALCGVARGCAGGGSGSRGLVRVGENGGLGRGIGCAAGLRVARGRPPAGAGSRLGPRWRSVKVTRRFCRRLRPANAHLDDSWPRRWVFALVGRVNFHLDSRPGSRWVFAAVKRVNFHLRRGDRMRWAFAGPGALPGTQPTFPSRSFSPLSGPNARRKPAADSRNDHRPSRPRGISHQSTVSTAFPATRRSSSASIALGPCDQGAVRSIWGSSFPAATRSASRRRSAEALRV